MNKTMTKEEYVASIRELEEIITKYREQEKRLKEQYINENKLFEVNEKVKITTPAFRRAIPDEMVEDIWTRNVNTGLWKIMRLIIREILSIFWLE